MGALIDLNGLGHYKSKENAMVASVYSATKTYAVGDYAYYNGTLYRCTTAITTAEAWTSGHWTAAKIGDDVTELKTAIDKVSDLSIPTGTDATGYYSGSVGDTISYTSQSSSHSFAIDLTNYIGRAVLVKFKTTSPNSSRITALCDANGIIISAIQESNIGAGILFYPNETYYKLYVSYSSMGSNLSVVALTKNSLDIYQDGSVAYVDASAASGGNGTELNPFTTIQDAINANASIIRAKSGTYPLFNISNRSKLKICLWDMPSYSTSQDDVPKIKITNPNANAGAVYITNCDEIELQDIWVDSPKRFGFQIVNVQTISMTRCYANSNTDSGYSLFSFINANCILNNCKAWEATLDGFNFHQYGNSQLIDCVAYDCGDDGVSHHEGCTGTIIGGEFYGNGKAGIASPYGGATVDIYDACCHDNTQYGIYSAGGSGSLNNKGIISNCVCVDNTDKDIYIAAGTIKGWNNIYVTKTVQETGTFTEYGVS